MASEQAAVALPNPRRQSVIAARETHYTETAVNTYADMITFVVKFELPQP
jgi:hypothetical protein